KPQHHPDLHPHRKHRAENRRRGQSPLQDQKVAPLPFPKNRKNAVSSWKETAFFSKLCAGMVLMVYRLEVLLDQLGVDLGGGNVAVAKHLLDGAKIGAVFQEVRREAVAQGVGR